jgi:hypothetical protein
VLAAGEPASQLLNALFGAGRNLYKRLAQFSSFQQPEVYSLFARRPFAELRACSERLATLLSDASGNRILSHEVIIDSPPPGREIEFRVNIYFPKEKCYRALHDVSPVVRTLAWDQFDDYVKRVRVFVAAAHLPQLTQLSNLSELLAEAARSG